MKKQLNIKMRKNPIHKVPTPAPPPPPVDTELDSAPKASTIDINALDPMYKVLINRGTKTKFVQLELFDPDDGGKLVCKTVQRTVADAFMFYKTHYPKLLMKWGGSLGVFRLILCGEYRKSPDSKKITLLNCIKLTRLVLA
jgi:hypothetical protein